MEQSLLEVKNVFVWLQLITNQGFLRQNLTTEAELRTEILKLRIENERLKKNYMVETTEDGKTHYIRLKAKNSK